MDNWIQNDIKLLKPQDKACLFISKFYEANDMGSNLTSNKWVMARHYCMSLDVNENNAWVAEIMILKQYMREWYFNQGTISLEFLNNVNLTLIQKLIIMKVVESEFSEIYTDNKLDIMGQLLLKKLEIDGSFFKPIQKEIILLDQILEDHDILYKQWFEKKNKQSFKY